MGEGGLLSCSACSSLFVCPIMAPHTPAVIEWEKEELPDSEPECM